MSRAAVGRKVIGLSGVRGTLAADDPRWNQRATVEVVTAAYDTDRLGVGSSPYRGDLATTGIRVPVAASTPDNRYRFRLASAVVPEKRSVILRGIRQLVTLRAEYETEPDELGNTETFVFEREVESPLWSFMDGNVSWHVKWRNIEETRTQLFDAARPPAASSSSSGVDASLLYVPPLVGPIPPPYVPLGGGLPAGRDVDYLGTWREMRYPWRKTSWDLWIPIVGPGVVVFEASVKQTNPATRPAIPHFVAPDMTGWRPEDAFLFTHTNAGAGVIYGHIAGALTLELYPDVKDMQQP